MLLDIIWNGIGLLCLYLIVRILLRLRRMCKGKGVKKTLATVLAGIVCGVLGLVFGVIAFVYIDDTGMVLSPTSEWRLITRGVIIAIFFTFCTYAAGKTAQKFLPGTYIKEALAYIAVLVSLLIVAQPIVVGWVMLLWPAP